MSQQPKSKWICRKNLKAGFKGNGIYPLNKNEVLKRIQTNEGAENDNGNSQIWKEAFTNFLKESRATGTQPLRKRKKKFNILLAKAFILPFFLIFSKRNLKVPPPLVKKEKRKVQQLLRLQWIRKDSENCTKFWWKWWSYFITWLKFWVGWLFVK